jgi:DNA-binding GntR family transcriptional regulator
MEEHMASLAALASRDEARAVAALVAHVSSARERALGM